MSRQRFATLLIAALVVLCAAFFLSSRRNPAEAPQTAALFPSFAAQIDTVTAVTVRKGDATSTVTLHKTGAEWTVAERADYPADVSKLRKLLSVLRDAKIIEEKTSNPARYGAIGVEDPSQPDWTGTEITVLTAAGKSGLIVGKATGDGNFVRRTGEKQSFSVEPAISLETEPKFWIDSRLLDVPSTQIKAIEYKPASGAAYALRSGAPDAAFTLDGTPRGRKPLPAAALAPSPNLLTALDAQDVAPSADIDFSKPLRVTVTLADGGVLTLTGVVSGARHWIEVSSSKDATLASRATGRAFEVASYRYDAIFKPLDQLLQSAAPAP